MTKLDRCGSLVVLFSLSTHIYTTIKRLMLFRTKWSRSTDLSVVLFFYESSRFPHWILNHSETTLFDVCCHLWGVKPHRWQTRLCFPLEQLIWSRFLGNGNAVLIRLSFEEHGCWASLHAVFGNIYYMYNFFAWCTSIVNLYRSPFSFRFSTVQCCFWKKWRTNLQRKGVWALLHLSLCVLDACVSVTEVWMYT